MASLYTRGKSPYYWLKFRDADGSIKQISTKCRVGIAPEARRAKQLEAEKSLEELKYGDARKINEGWAWVSEFLNIRYQNQEATLERCLNTWTTLTMFIEERKIPSPAAFLRQHCFDFIKWRQKADKGNGKYKAGLNTALLELKVMRVIMFEAMSRGIINGNPCVKLGIKKAAVKEKPPLTPEECELILQKIKTVEDQVVQDMLFYSFTIARYQGCRLKETRLNPQTDVAIHSGTENGKEVKVGEIRFEGKTGEFWTMLHPKLIPIFEDLKAKGRTTTWAPPSEEKKRQWAANKWWKFLKRIGLKERGITFHSTRVTIATELAIKNVPENKAMRYLGHKSETVHRIYQRMKAKHLPECVAAIG